MNIFPVCRVRSKAPMEKQRELRPDMSSVGKDIPRLTSCEEFWINIEQCLLVVLKPHSCPVPEVTVTCSLCYREGVSGIWDFMLLWWDIAGTSLGNPGWPRDLLQLPGCTEQMLNRNSVH